MKSQMIINYNKVDFISCPIEGNQSVKHLTLDHQKCYKILSCYSILNRYTHESLNCIFNKPIKIGLISPSQLCNTQSCSM